ncbi:hypothetical protein AC578_5979 [Pseudocercospora eumusae]|uniref:Uncharacterized protein n=1 Tax=Pseudocercospora eumusae TaxID=321146 RepID=A0A139HIB8_9PEZI|nr:hypothetical protein AC578_5979 [Pseudocercospora eumusae]
MTGHQQSFNEESAEAPRQCQVQSSRIEVDVQEGNIILSMNNSSILDALVEEEHQNPSPCRKADDRIIYSSVEFDMPDDPGQSVVCNFGDAQFGQFAVEVMPELHRTPEIVLGIHGTRRSIYGALG